MSSCSCVVDHLLGLLGSLLQNFCIYDHHTRAKNDINLLMLSLGYMLNLTIMYP